MNNARRTFLGALGALAALGALPRAQAATPMTMYMNIGCGCCEQWESHMRAHGFAIEKHRVADVTPMKRTLGVPENLYSCHTAVIGGYVIEGHVPAADVQRLLHERPKVKGLSVPGMVSGSPGMDQGPAQPFATIAFDERGTQVYARH
ncbi:MAG TPA: DUF411 domain-containing protein [Burkholderiales bacterium]|nr:DUF411 domain-containing protein [Burkholderiales bacterium]